MDHFVSLSLSKTTNFRLFADDNFKFDENGRKLSKRVENTMEKGEIARDEQFLFFPQCFQKSSTTNIYKPGLIWERVKSPSLVMMNLFTIDRF